MLRTSWILICTLLLHQNVQAALPRIGGDAPKEPDPEPFIPSNPRPVVGSGGSIGSGSSGSSSSEQAAEKVSEALDNLKDLIEKIADAVKDALDTSSSSLADGQSPTSSPSGSRSSTSSSTRSSGFGSASASGTKAPATTRGPSITGDATGCLSVQSVYASCSYQGNPKCKRDIIDSSNSIINCQQNNGGGNFGALPQTVQASCLCYPNAISASKTSNPFNSWYDGWNSQCNRYLATMSLPSTTAVGAGNVFTQTQAVAAITSALGLCSKAGDVKAAAASATTTSATSASSSSSTISVASPTSAANTARWHGGSSSVVLAVLTSILALAYGQ